MAPGWNRPCAVEYAKILRSVRTSRSPELLRLAEGWDQSEVDVRDGRRRRILSNTSLDVTDWR